MRVALTGPTGFIGRHVLAELGRRNVEIVALSRHHDVSFKNEKVTFVALDITSATSVDYNDIGSPDVLIHAAWGGLPNYSSLHHIEQELPLQYSFLSRLIKSGLPALVVTGTCFEYGMQSGPLSESNPTRPITSYGLAKDILRRQLEMLKSHHNFNLAWGRIFYPYGEGQGPKSLLSQLRDSVLKGDAAFNMSGGEQLRDYLPVELVADYLVDLAVMRADCGPVNICSGEPVSIRRLVEAWLEKNNASIALNLGHYPYTDYEPMAFWGDNLRLNQTLQRQSRQSVYSEPARR